MSLIKRKYSGIETISAAFINSLELNLITNFFSNRNLCACCLRILMFQIYSFIMKKLIDYSI